MKSIGSIILVIFFAAQSFSQSKVLRETKAKRNIELLKDGVLLVRLQSKQKTIEILKEKGYPKKAKYFRERQLKDNKEIARSFNNMDFCKVYFFYSHDSDLLLNGLFDSISFLNEKLDTILLKLDTFFIADIGELNQTAKLDTTNQTLDKEKIKGNKRKKSYSGGTKLSFKSLYIRDMDFNVLTKPFPFYQRYHPIPLTVLTNEEVVLKLNDRLKDFYKSIK